MQREKPPYHFEYLVAWNASSEQSSMKLGRPRKREQDELMKRARCLFTPTGV